MWLPLDVFRCANLTQHKRTCLLIVHKNQFQIGLLNGLQWLAAVVVVQIILGILTILSYVNIVVALLHQAGAIALFALAIYFIHRFRALDQTK